MFLGYAVSTFFFAGMKLFGGCGTFMATRSVASATALYFPLVSRQLRETTKHT